MIEKEYKEDHIPHRVNLLITYRERFANVKPEQRQKVRDFNICAKDISSLMVRFFLGEMGINLKEGNSDISEKKVSKFAKRLLVKDVIRDPLYDEIVEVLIFANRAIAHIEDSSVNHNFKTQADDLRLFNVITYTENKIKTHIYASEQEFQSAMLLSHNDMQRHLLNLNQ